MPAKPQRYPPPPRRFELAFSFLSVLLACAALLALAAMSSGWAAAQTATATPTAAPTATPTPLSPETCGLPAGGNVGVDATYTLNADCTQTGVLSIGSEFSPNKISVTINGGGNTVTGQDGWISIRVLQNAELTISNITFSDGGRLSQGTLSFENSRHGATISNVTFRDTDNTAIHFGSTTGPEVTHSLSSILIENASGIYYSRPHGIPSGIHAIGPANLNINRIVLRNIRTGNAAIGANDNYILRDDIFKGTITFSGCLTADGVLPLLYYGDIVDRTNNTECTGTIGNGGTSAKQYSQKSNAPCGLPDGGWIFGSNTFNLSATCTISETFLLPASSNVTINGNGNTINLNGLTVGMRAWGNLTLRNVVITGAGLAPIVTYLDKTVRISDSTFHNNAGPIVFQDSIASLERVTIRDHTINRDWPSAIFVNLSSRVTIRDSVFRGNSGGKGAIWTGRSYQYGADPATRLVANTNTFESNTNADGLPVNIADEAGFLQTISAPAAPMRDDDDSDGGSARISATPIPQPRVPTGESLMATTGIKVSAPFGLDSGIQFQRRDARAIGIQSVIDAGFIDVVDIWGYAEQGWEVCFPQSGQFVFLDAANSPRAPEPMTAYRNVAGYTCASDQRAGMLVLVPGLPAPPAAGASPTPADHAGRLHNCMVTTEAIVNFRESPGGKRVADFVDPRGDTIAGWLPWHVTLTALERADGWFKVDYYGLQGWISAEWVSPQGNCG